MKSGVTPDWFVLSSVNRCRLHDDTLGAAWRLAPIDEGDIKNTVECDVALNDELIKLTQLPAAEFDRFIVQAPQSGVNRR